MMPTALIRGERVSLRPVRLEDVDHLLRWATHPEVARLAQGGYPVTREGTLKWLQEALHDRYRKLFLILGPDGTPIGDIDVHHIAWRSGEGELRIRIGEPPLWGRGYGTDAIRTLLRHLFQHGHLRRIYLRVLRDNHRAVRCYRKCGFRVEGRRVERRQDGQLQEVLLMSVRLEELDYVQPPSWPQAG